MERTASSGDADQRPGAQSSFAGPLDLKTLNDALPVVVFTVAMPARRIEYVNQAISHILGYAPAETVGQSTRMLYPETSDYEAFGSELRRALERGDPQVHQECELLRKDGCRIHASIDTTFVHEGGRLARAVSVVRDDTARRRAEDALRAEKERVRQYLDLTGAMILALDAAGRVSLINRSGCQILGCTHEELIGRDWIESFVPEEERSRVRDYFDSVMRGASMAEFVESRVLTRRGPRMLSWHNATLRDGAGRPVGTLSSAEDVTDQHRARQELARSERFHKAVFQNRAAGIGVVDDGLRITHANSAFAALLGLDDGAVVGHRLSDQLTRAGTRALEGLVGSAVSSGSEVVGVDIARPDGGRRHLLLSAATIRGGAPEEPGDTLLVAVDATAAHGLERSLRQAQKLESLGLLAGGIAHDFNNLLVGILGNAELAAEEIGPASPSRPLLDDVASAAQRAAELAAQMLAYSGRAARETEPLDLDDVIEGMGSLLRSSIARNCALELALSRTLPRVVGDADQIRQALLNLVINASEAVGEKGGVLKVATREAWWDRQLLASSYVDDDLPEGRYVVVEVTDSGDGMPPETIARMFDPFFTTRFQGRGLGLSAVLGIVRSHRGAVRVESAPGEGTTVTVALPVAHAAGPGPPAEKHRAGTPSALVLVVDDEDSVRRAAVRMLDRLGYQRLAASGGAEALEIVRRGTPAVDVVLLDLTMPAMDGEAALAALRELAPELPVVLMSGYSVSDLTRRFEGHRLAGFLAKPFRLRDLGGVLRSALSGPDTEER